MSADAFDYHQAFARNLGWVTATEQVALRRMRVAIAGLGGVGGSHLLTLARLGVGRFTLAEMDRFEPANSNRQAGAFVSTMGQEKIAVMAAMARDVNPGLELRLFPDGVSPDGADGFLEGADLYVDSLDFFAFEARAAVFAACARRGIPAITAAPLGFGCAWMSFVPGRCTFADYMRWDQVRDDLGRGVRLLVGLSPRLLHAPCLVAPEHLDLAGRRGPSTCAAVQLCAGVAAAEAVKLLLRRGEVRACPHGRQFDPFRGIFSRTWRPGGNANPLQRLVIALVERRMRAQAGVAA